MIQRSLPLSRLAPALALSAVTAAALSACGGFIEKSAIETTSKVLKRAQPSLKMESDYELAARAIPGTLKTVEGFWMAHATPITRDLLTEGYCQYAIGFVEDEWEVALVNKDFDLAAYHEVRATKMFLRCMNYALMALGSKWQEGLFAWPFVADEECDKGVIGIPQPKCPDPGKSLTKLVAGARSSQRTPLMWAAVGLGSMINHNKDNVELVAQAPTAKLMLLKVVELDAARPPKDLALAALPHVALGMLYTAAGAQLGGDAAKATEHFKKALEITGDRFLLARVNYARKVGVMTQNRQLFRDELIKVLQTDPGIWPEQRLANEIAHRRARRYLSQEKELF